MSLPMVKPESEGGKLRLPDNRIHIVANGTSAAYHGEAMSWLQASYAWLDLFEVLKVGGKEGR